MTMTMAHWTIAAWCFGVALVVADGAPAAGDLHRVDRCFVSTWTCAQRTEFRSAGLLRVWLTGRGVGPSPTHGRRLVPSRVRRRSSGSGGRLLLHMRGASTESLLDECAKAEPGISALEPLALT